MTAAANAHLNRKWSPAVCRTKPQQTPTFDRYEIRKSERVRLRIVVQWLRKREGRYEIVIWEFLHQTCCSSLVNMCTSMSLLWTQTRIKLSIEQSNQSERPFSYLKCWRLSCRPPFCKSINQSLIVDLRSLIVIYNKNSIFDWICCNFCNKLVWNLFCHIFSS